MSDTLSDYITTRQAADMLGVARTHINKLLTMGKLKGKKLGNDWVVYQPSIAEYERTKSLRGRPRLHDSPTK